MSACSILFQIARFLSHDPGRTSSLKLLGVLAKLNATIRSAITASLSFVMIRGCRKVLPVAQTIIVISSSTSILMLTLLHQTELEA